MRFMLFEMCKCESSILPEREMTRGIHSSSAEEGERSRSPPGGRRGILQERGESAWT